MMGMGKGKNEETETLHKISLYVLNFVEQGRRNSVVAGRKGFDELYLFSPGSSHEFYSKYSYICVGASAMLKPIMLRPGDVWKGGQQLHNPNL